jgi:ribosomal protein L34E
LIRSTRDNMMEILQICQDKEQSVKHIIRGKFELIRPCHCVALSHALKNTFRPYCQCFCARAANSSINRSNCSASSAAS